MAYRFWLKKIIFSWIPSRQVPVKCVLRKYVIPFYNISIFGGSLVFWIRLFRNYGSIICVIKNIILIRKLKISEQVFRKWKIKIYVLMFHIMFMGVSSVYPTCVTIKNWCRKRINPVQRYIKFNFDHKMVIYHRDWVRWIGNVIRIHLYTFKIIDRHNSCLHGCVMCWQFLSIPPTLN